jgi:hypothetical protein
MRSKEIQLNARITSTVRRARAAGHELYRLSAEYKSELLDLKLKSSLVYNDTTTGIYGRNDVNFAMNDDRPIRR